MERRAWRAYWWTVATWVMALVLYLILRGSVESKMLWGVVLALPPLFAGLNLVLFSKSHEQVCATEVARHRWLRIITMGGYSQRTFLLTGLVAVASSVFIAVAVAGGR